VSQQYAGVLTRSAALVVDAALVATVASGVAVVVGLVGATFGYRDAARVVVALAVVAFPAVLALYNAGFWALVGRTPGMALFGVRVVPGRGGPLRWPAALVRALVFAVFPIGALGSVVDRRHQAVHDKLARTVVVRAG
jgi:uncharacterized RDD family membrane protein YckC